MYEKEVCNFHEIHTPGVLVGLSFAVKKMCNIHFQCRRKNVIMVDYGKSDCGPCPCDLSLSQVWEDVELVLTWSGRM